MGDKDVLHFHLSRKMREEAQGWAEKQGHRDSDQGADQKEEIITSHTVS